MQQIIRCPNCGSPNSFGQSFCGACGARLVTGCPNCGSSIDPGARFCGSCGAQLSGGVQQPGGWGQTPGDMQQPGGWGQPPGGVQQPGGWGQPPGGMQQPGGWGQPPGGMQQAGMWGAPARRRTTSSQSGTFLLVILIVLLAGLGVFGYYAFFSDSPPWGGGTAVTPTDILKFKGGPFVSGTSDNTTGKASMAITWETDELTKGRVEYGMDTDYGKMSDWESNFVKSHSVDLSNLDADTSYHYRIISKDKDDKQSASNDRSFKTPK